MNAGSIALIGTEAPTLQRRIASVDTLRGLVIVIMALDHVREYWGITPLRPEDLSQAPAMLFLTRWITHLCAPTFLFLAGLSVNLYQQKTGQAQSRKFLLTRGVWLLAVEIFIISFIMVQGYGLTVLSVIWVIGCSMIFMTAVVSFPRWLLLAISFVMIAGHNLLPNITVGSLSDALLAMLHNTPFFLNEPRPILVTYTIVPWLGVMMFGFVVGSWYTYDSRRRDSMITYTALSLLIAFLAIRTLNTYGDPSPWTVSERGPVFTILAFVNVTKYPPSLLFLCLMLGIALLILVYYNKSPHGRVKEWLAVYGRVPFFFFVMHFAVISVSSMIWTRVQFGHVVNIGFSGAEQLPNDYEPSLLRVYLVWILVIAAMYFPCKWFGDYRRRSTQWWLKYL